MNPQFSVGDLLATNLEMQVPVYGYVVSWSVEDEGIKYLLTDEWSKQFEYYEVNLRLVDRLFCPTDLKWVIAN